MWVEGRLTNPSFRGPPPHSDLWFSFISPACHAVCRAAISMFHLAKRLTSGRIGHVTDMAVWFFVVLKNEVTPICRMMINETSWHVGGNEE